MINPTNFNERRSVGPLAFAAWIIDSDTNATAGSNKNPAADEYWISHLAADGTVSSPTTAKPPRWEKMLCPGFMADITVFAPSDTAASRRMYRVQVVVKSVSSAGVPDVDVRAISSSSATATKD